jgi:hypothetical protein
MTPAQAAAVKLIDDLRSAVAVKAMGGEPTITLSEWQTLLAFLEEANGEVSAIKEAELRGYKRGIEDAAKWHEYKKLEAIRDRDSVSAQSSIEHFQHIADRHRDYAAAIRKLEPK